MVASKQQAVLLLAAGLLLLALQSADAACCTIGQPSYVGDQFVGNFRVFGACSDGPCSGPGFNYSTVTGGAKESLEPDSCCFAGPGIEDPQGGFYYNPRRGSPQNNPPQGFWAYNVTTLFGLTFPGTSPTCNASLARWSCTIGGVDVPTCQDTDVGKNGSQPFPCPEGWVFDVNTTSIVLTKEECCLPLPRLAIISRFPSEYTGITANLTATSTQDSCQKIPSPREGVGGVTILQPKNGSCGTNSSGFVKPGTYVLDAGKPPKDTVFQRWECTNITLGSLGTTVLEQNVTLAGNSSMTCVAVFGLLPLPKLALISKYPDSYNGPPANLTAIGANGLNASCIQAPSQRLGQNGTTIEQPGAGLCGVNGTMPIGKYNLNQSPPPGLSFDGYICYDVVNATNSTVRQDEAEDVQLQRNDVVTCVANYVARPKLALTSRFPAAYNGPTANLTAMAFSDSCTKIFSPRQGFNNVTVLQPGLGQCGAEGFVNQGQYQLNQTAPDGTTFIGWRCTDITFGVEGAVSTALFVQLSGNQSKSCVAEYNYTAPAPPPSPAPSPQPKLALISDFPASYTGPTANLSASSATATCVEAPSARFNTSNVTLVSPGEGLCNGNGNMPPGAYNFFTQIAPPGTVFVGWQCYAIDTVNGVTTLVSSGMNPVIGLSNNDFITCKANYSLAPSPKLALTSEFPPSYVGITSNITATSANNDTCIEAPSTRLNATANITILTPGPGFCRTDGSMPPGNYTLTQDPPPGVVLDRVECYDISNGTELLVPTNGSVGLSGNKTISCKMVYVFAASPSPSPAPLPQPRLALTSQFPSEYSSSAPTANLTATSNSAPPSICDESPSTRLLLNNVTISMPGAGFCNQSNNGNMPPGNYSLSQSPPPGTKFDRWDCYKVTNSSQTPVNITSGVILQGEDFISCVALYALVDPTCGDVQPGTPGPQPYNCSRSTMARNDSAAASSPPSDLACCQPTCADTNIMAPTAPAVPWTCPVNTTLKPNAAALFPPSNTTCCKGEVPFSINKTGPALVKSGQAFNFDVLVVFKGATTGVTITDDLPAGLVPGTTTAATWTATSSVSGNPASGNCTTTPSTSPEFTCNLGATTSWAAGDIIRVTVPVLASPSPGSILTNVANVFDLKNESASSNASVEICKDCGIAGECFDAFKTGPSTVFAGQAFDFKVAVRFFSKPAGPVTVNDTLPAGLQPTSALAAWKATFANGTTLTNNKCATIGSTFSCSLGADWTKGDLVEIIMRVEATAGASGNVVNRAVVTDGNLTKLPESPVIILPDNTGAPFTITKTGPSSVKVGEAFDYNLVVTFLGSATGVVVSDELPAQLTATSSPGTWKAITGNGANPSGECTTSSSSGGTRQRITCILGQSATWAKGDRVEVRLPVIASASAQGAVNNTATITDNLNRTNEDSHLTVVVQLPGSPFTITKTGPTQPVLAGQVFNYNIIVSFLGPATGVNVRDQLPTQVTPQGAATWTSRKTATPTACTTSVGSPTFIGCDLGQSVTWAAGDTVEVTVPVTAGLNGAVNAINTAIVSDNQGRQSNATFPITINVDSAAPFTILKAGPTRVEQNAPFNFEVTVVFMSSVTAARIVDNLPPGLWPTGTATWTAISNNGVPSGSCVTVNRTATTEASYTCDLGPTTIWQRGDRIKLLVPSVASTVAVPLVNRATVSDNTGRNANASATVIADTPNIPQSVLRIDKTGPLTAVSPGQAFTFTIRVDFDQVGPFTAVRIVDDLPAGLLTSLTAATWTATKSGSQLTGTCVTTPSTSPEIACDLGAVSWTAGDFVIVTVPVIAGSTAGVNLVNRATVNATLNGRNIILDDTASVNVTVPLLKVSKIGPGVPVAANVTFPWTLTAGVTGDVPVNPLIVVDELPNTDIKFVAPIPSNCVQNSDQRVTCTWNESVGPGNDKVVQLRAVASKAGTYTNKATVFTTQPGVANQTANADAVIVENTPGFSPAPPVEVIQVDKKGPTQAIEVGKEFTFTLTPAVKAGPVTTMTLTDTIDASTGVSFVRVSPNAGCTVQPQLLTCTLSAPFGPLTLTAKGTKAGTFTNRVDVRSPSGASGSDQADVTLIAPGTETCGTWVAKNGCQEGQILNPSSANDPIKSNITSFIRLQCCTLAAQSTPDVSLKKLVSKATNTQGSRFNYTFEVKNLALDTTAYNVIVSDLFPVGIAPTNNYWIVPGSAGSVCSFTGVDMRNMQCVLGTVLSGATRKVTVEVTADGKNFAADGTTTQAVLSNTAKLTCAGSSTAATQDPACDKTSKVDVTVIKAPPTKNTVGITKTASPSSGAAGTVFTFTIVVTPSGPVDNVIVTDPIPSQLTNAQLLTTFGGKCTIAAQRRARAAVTTPAATTPAATAALKGSGNKAMDDAINAIRKNNNKKNNNNMATTNTTGARQAVTQQTLRCNFGTISTPQEIRFTATGSSLGTFTNVATVTFTGSDSPKDATATVTVINPPRQQGSCCDGSYSCRTNVDEASCTSSGGTWSSSSTACNTKMFCSGACCTGGNTAGAYCRLTKKNKCGGGLRFAAGAWDPNGDCNDPTFCPKPPQNQCMSKCQQCDLNNPCCPGLSCLPAGNGWYTSRYICCQTPYYAAYAAKLAGASASASASAATAAVPDSPAAATSAAMQTFTTPANVKNTFCSKTGGLCGRHDNGRQCCGPRADCVVGDGAIARCVSRGTCSAEGSSCSGTPGKCCSGLTCQNSKCRRAQCKTPSKCQPRDYLCKYWHELNCEAYYAAATSSPDR